MERERLPTAVRRAGVAVLGGLALGVAAAIVSKAAKSDHAARAVGQLTRTAKGLAADAGSPLRGIRRGALSQRWAYHHERYLRFGDPRQLRLAIETLDAAVRLAPVGHPMRGMHLTNLGLTLEQSYDDLGDPADLDAAIESLRGAVTATPPGHFRRGWCLANLGVALQSRGAARDASADLDEAIRLLRDATVVVRVDAPERAIIVSNLAGALRARGEKTGSVLDLDEAVRTLRAALAIITTDHPDHRLISKNLYGAARVLDRTSRADHGEPAAAAPRTLEGVPHDDLSELVAAFGTVAPATELFTDTMDRLKRFVRGDGEAVTDVEALALAARLWSLAAEDRHASHAVGLLAWCRFLIEEDPFHTEDLALALSRLAPDARPDLVRRIFAVDLPDGMEPGVDDAPCHPGRLDVIAARLQAESAAERPESALALLRRAVALTRLAVELTRPDGELIDMILAGHADAVLRLSGAADDPGLLAEVVTLRRLCVEKARPGQDRAREFLWELGLALVMLYAHEPDAALLAEAEDALERSEAVQQSNRYGSGTAAERASKMSGVLQVYLLDAEEHGYTDHKHLAWARAVRALDRIAGDKAVKVQSAAPYSETDPSSIMGVDLYALEIQRIEERLTGDDADDDLGERTAVVAELADAHRRRFNSRHARADLNDALALSEKAVELCPKGHPRRPHCLWTRIACLDARYQVDHHPSDLDPIIDLLRELLTLPGDLARRDHEQVALANYLIGRADPDRPDLPEAEAILRRVVAKASPDSEAGLMGRGLLGTLTMARLAAGEPADFDAGIDLLRQAAELPEAHENHPVLLGNLATALLARYATDGAASDLDEAIERATAATAAVRSHGRWIQAATAAEPFVTGLLMRYRVRGAYHDLEEAVRGARGFVEALRSPDHPRTPKSLAVLAEALAERAARNRSAADLDEAVRAARAAADADPQHRRTLAAVLATPLDMPDDRPHLAEALTLSRHLYADEPDAKARITLAAILRERFRQTSADGTPDLALSHEAERLYREALRHARSKADLRFALGAVLADRAEGDLVMLGEAASLFRSAALDSSAPAFTRITAAQRCGAVLADRGDWEDAADAYGTAIELLPRLAARTLARADREYWLGQVTDLAGGAAEAAVQAGTPERAVRLFEAARGVLWTQLLETRDDLTGLAPELADRVEELRAGLDAPLTPALDGHVPYSWENKYTAAPIEDARRRSDAWTGLVAEIRAVPGFEDFARPSGSGPLHPGVPGPVVLVAAGRHHGHALLLFPGDRIEPVALPGLTAATARSRADGLRSALTAIQHPDSGHGDRLRGEAELLELLHWLGETVTLPVLKALGPATSRLWWLPAGPLTSLPLHAAGGALNRVTSSYAFGLRTLRSAVTGPLPPRPRTLVVAMPDTPGEQPLPRVQAEVAWLRDRYDPTEFLGSRATRAEVLSALPDAELAHFACHSSSGRDGKIFLADHQTAPLTLLDIAGLHLPRARLAYLSSCATVATDLPDEAVHLAAAFHHAGFPGVIATLWPLADIAALPVSRAFYDSSDDPATSLRAATIALATAHPRNPSLWACHIHLGT
ncbi:CHAT domain-containing protein [Streptomyces filipinensis]|uniref:CHAT domain-containing protein n=1 Tax=Streptomyces filipinensis TaxID=66887 RepID=UPI0017823C09|nr:CHAT domain-containing protein [Streptomyces filipinensis]